MIKNKVWICLLALIFALGFTDVLFSESFTENFKTIQYKDTPATSASWGYSGSATLRIKQNGLVNVWTSDTSYEVQGGLALDTNYAYIAVDSGGVPRELIVFDISNPSSAIRIGSAIDYQPRGGILLKDTAVYVPQYINKIRVYDVTNKTSPAYLGTIPTYTASPWGTDFSETNFFAMGYGESRLYVYSLPVPVSATPLSTSPVIAITYPQYIKHGNNYVYSTLSGTFVVIDVSNPNSPSITSTTIFSGANFNRSIVQGNYVIVVCSVDNVLRCIDVTNPASPIQTGSLTVSGGGGSSIAKWGNYAFTAGSKTLLVDIADPTKPDTVCVLSVASSYIDVKNGYVMIASITSGPPRIYKIYFDTSCVLQSKSVITTSAPIAGATLTASDTIPTGTSVEYYMSADGGNNWEGPVTKGTRWSFYNAGTSLKWKAVLTTNDSAATPYVYGVTVQTTGDINAPVWTGDINLKTYLSVMDSGAYSATLTWNSVADSSVVVYHIQKKTGGSDWEQVDTTLALTYQFSGLSNTNTYRFRIKPVDISNNEGDWKECYDDTPPVWTPDYKIKESGFFVEDNKTKISVIVSWNTASDNTGDFIFYEVESKTGNAEWEKETFTSLNLYEKKDFDGNSANGFSVRARDVAGNFTNWSEITISRIASGEINEEGGRVALDDFDGNSANDAYVELPKNAVKKKVSFRIYRYPNDEYEFKMLDAETGKAIEPAVFNGPVTISVPYKKSVVLSQGWNEEELGIYYFDGIKWLAIGGVVDRTNTIVKARVFHFTVFRVSKARSANKGEFNVTVNPAVFTPNTDGINDSVRFDFVLGDDLLGKDGIITIYDAGGKVVKVIGTQQATSVVWDGSDGTGGLLESGLYLYVVSMSGKTQTGSVVIAR